MQFPKTFWLIGVITTELATHPGCARSRERGGSARQGRGTAVAVPPQPVVPSDSTALPSRPSLWAGGEGGGGRAPWCMRGRERERGGVAGQMGVREVVIGPADRRRAQGALRGRAQPAIPGFPACPQLPPPPGLEGKPHPGHIRGREGRMRCGARSGGALQGRDCHPVANHRLSEPGFWSAAALHSPAPRGLAARAGRTRLYAGQRGAHTVWNGPARRPRTRRGRSTGQGLPSRAPTTGCQNRDFGPRQLCIRPPPGGWRQGRGAPDYMQGREGRIRCGTGRCAEGERGGSALCRVMAGE